MIGPYLRRVVNDFWNAINLFWFSRRSTLDIAIVRVVFGFWLAAYALSWWISLPNLIAANGLVDRELTRYLIGDGIAGTGSVGRISWLYWTESRLGCYAYLIATMVAGLAMTLGLGGRWIVGLATILGLGLAHRVPMLQGAGDACVLSMLGYLIIDSGRNTRFTRLGFHDREERTTANFAWRLLQTHLILWLAVAWISQIAEPMWWTGVAVWWLAENERSLWLSREYLSDKPFLINIISYSMLAAQGASLVCLMKSGWRTIGIFCGFMFAILVWGIAGELWYAISIVVLISIFAGVACREWSTSASDEQASSETSRDTQQPTASLAAVGKGAVQNSSSARPNRKGKNVRSR
jgi:hypothetical protein